MSKSNKNRKKIAEKIYNKYLKQMEKIVGNTTTFSDQLEKTGKRLFKGRFMGVFPADLVPKKIPKGKCLIANLDNSNESGSHWVSICKSKKSGIIWVFDSFGRKSYNIIPSIHGSGRKIKNTENDREQRVSETNCGAQSMAFIKLFIDYGEEYGKYI